MPFYKEILFPSSTKAYIWKITEDYNDLFRAVLLKDSSLFRLEKMKSESHQKGFLAVRMLLQHLGYNDFDLEYDETGKPHLKVDFENLSQLENLSQHQKSENLLPEALESNKFISISHSGDFSAIVISQEKIGIDLEKMKDKVLKIAPRFMDVSHLENLHQEDQIKKSTIIWGIKEAIFKVKNQVGISFPDHIFEDKFEIEDKKCSAQLHFSNKIENFDIAFDFVEDYALVCAFEKK